MHSRVPEPEPVAPQKEARETAKREPKAAEPDFPSAVRQYAGDCARYLDALVARAAAITPPHKQRAERRAELNNQLAAMALHPATP